MIRLRLYGRVFGAQLTIPYALVVTTLVAVGGRAQTTSAKDAPPPFVEPLSREHPINIPVIAGQVVVTPPDGHWMQSVTRLRIALFDARRQVSQSVLTGEQGEFEFVDVPPGAYALVAGPSSVHPIGVPIYVGPRKPGATVPSSGILLILRLSGDKRPSTFQPIRNMALRNELRSMVRQDQDVRNAWIKQGYEHPAKAVQARLDAVDLANRTRMRQIVRQSGWPGPQTVGVDGTEAAFLLVQHADLDFQKQMLPLVSAAYKRGDLPGQDFALLQDRVLTREGKPQIYGTQGEPFDKWKNGEPTLSPIADEANVDKRRAEVGLFPLAEYKKMLKKMYTRSGSSAGTAAAK